MNDGDGFDDLLGLLSFGERWPDDVAQTIALLVRHLPARIAGSLLSGLTSCMQADVAIRIAGLDRADPATVRATAELLQRPLGSLLGTPVDLPDTGSAGELASLLGQVDRRTEHVMLEALRREDPLLAAQVRERLLLFEDLLRLDDRSVQQLMREISIRDLMSALRGAGAEVQDLFLGNMSARAATMFREDMDGARFVVSDAEVSRAQRRVVDVAWRLQHVGRIVIPRATDEPPSDER
jgi:flagellar motor switch protein FliG